MSVYISRGGSHTVMATVSSNALLWYYDQLSMRQWGISSFSTVEFQRRI